MGSNILLTGGSGLLGQELKKYVPFEYWSPSHEEFDITDITSFYQINPNLIKNIDTIIHCAAYTDVEKAEVEKEKCFKVNYVGILNLIKIFRIKKFIYISSEYVRNPVNFYSYTKLWGEELIRNFLELKQYLIIRTLFKPKPYPYKYAFFDQYTTGDYVDIIAPMIVNEIIKNNYGIIDIGTGRKTLFELARQTKPDIKAISVNDITNVKLPNDYLIINGN